MKIDSSNIIRLPWIICTSLPAKSTSHNTVKTSMTRGCLWCWQHSDLQFVPVSSGADKDLEESAFSKVAFLAYPLMLSKIIIRERREEKLFSHPIQCLDLWKAPLFSSTPSTGPWPREGEKPALEEKGRWFFGECPDVREPELAEPHPIPSPPLQSHHSGPAPPRPRSEHQRETPYGEKPPKSGWFPALGGGWPGEAPRGRLVCASGGLPQTLWGGGCPGRSGTAGEQRVPRAIPASPGEDSAPGGRLQNSKIKVCHLAVASGFREQPPKRPVFRWSVYDFWNIDSFSVSAFLLLRL